MGFCFFFVFFTSKRTGPTASAREPCLMYLSTSNEASPRERSDRGRFLPLGQESLFIPGCVQGTIIYLVCLSVCLSVCQCVCNIRRFYWLRELYEADFHKPGFYGSGRVWANACDVFRRAPSRGGHGRRAAVDVVVCFGWGGFFFIFFIFIFVFSRTHTACCKYEAALPHLTLY